MNQPLECKHQVSLALFHAFLTLLTHLLPDGPKPVVMNGHAMNGVVAQNGAGVNGAPAAPTVPPQPPVAFTNNQINALRAQIAAFKYISRGIPVPEILQEAIHPDAPLAADQDAAAATADPSARVADAAVRVHKGLEEKDENNEDVNMEEPSGPFIEDDTASAIYPYNAFTHPFTYLKQPNPTRDVYETKLQRLLLPSVMPAGLDPHQILAERNRFIEARIEQRIRELSAMPGTLGDGAPPPAVVDDGSIVPGQSHGKLRALIELKSLRLRDRQRALRAQLVERIGHSSVIPLDRQQFKRYRKPTTRDTRQTELAERDQRQARERRAKDKHVEYLDGICNHGKLAVLGAGKEQREKAQKIGRNVLRLHEATEKEEQKRIERLAKERLKALKNDDEEAYLKLLDTAKDTRITHLLKQTDSYLDSLSAAVAAQQNIDPETLRQLADGGGADETMFGASRSEDAPVEKGKVDYYAIAHRIQEPVTKQPNILIGGKLKDYQLKGLQWMVSLYNNRLNGILADEMGLGKTIQTISLVSYLTETKRLPGPFLVIVPLSTLTNWTLEFQKWAPQLRMISYKGTPNTRRALQNDMRMPFHVLLTTYEYIIKDRPVLSKFRYLHMIIGTFISFSSGELR